MALIKVYNGSSWVTVNPKHYSGAAWVDHETKFYNGSAWVSLDAEVAADTVTVSGETVTHDVSNGNTATAAVVINTDGTIDKLVGSTLTQIDTSTDWVRPDGAGSGTGYYFKYTLTGTASYNPGALVANTWYEITSNRSIGARETANDSQEDHFITVYIADAANDSNIIDSGFFSCTATVGLPP